MRLLLLLVALFQVAWASSSLSTKPVDVPQDFVNIKVNRILDLSSPSLARETVVLSAKNVAGRKSGSYVLSMDQTLADVHLSYVEVRQKLGDKLGNELHIVKTQTDSLSNVQLFKVTLDPPVAADDKFQLQITFVYIGMTNNLPKQVNQDQRSSVEYRGNVYFDTPYPTESQKTTVKLPAGKVHEVEPQSGVSGNQHSFGPFTDVIPHSHKELYLHYEISGAPLSATLLRNLEISHWGSRLEVADEWDLQNLGPTLKKPFSRIDFSKTYMFQQATTAINSLSFQLPANARDAYFRDFDGNVSTSHFRNEASKAVLDLRPRYPIYGGWHYRWMQGYDVPLGGSQPLLKYDKKNGRYVFKGKLVDGIKFVPISRLRLQVVLPEGAHNVKLHMPFPPDKEEVGRHYSYLDSVGRPTVIIEKNNLVDEHFQDFQVSYEFSSMTYFRKPIVLTVACLSAFLATMAYMRTNLAISENAGDDALKAHVQATQQVRQKIKAHHAKADQHFVDYKDSHRDLSKFEKLRIESEKVAKELEVELKELVEKISKLATNQSEKVKQQLDQLIKLLNDRWNKLKAKQDEVVSLHKTDNVDEKKRKQVAEKLKVYDQALNDLDKQIKQAEDVLNKSI